MSNFETKEELLKSIENYLINIDEGILTLKDLEHLVDKTKELYERAIILRFKAFEQKVFGNDITTEVTEEKITPLETEHQETAIEETTSEKETGNILTENTNPEPVFDFSIFENEDEKPIDEVESQINESNNSIIDEKNDDLIDSVDNEEVVEGLNSENENSDQQTLEEKKESHESQHIESEHIDKSNQEIEDLLKNILVKDDSLASKLMFSKLDTLIGSFGFNERFQTVQELFNGSNEDFNQALTVLDQFQNFDEAKKQLLFYIKLKNWNLEQQICVDFIQKVQRRYS
jgi:hypothetical protein